jgi:hypothetical protein
MSPDEVRRVWFVVASMALYFVANIVISWKRGGWKAESVAVAVCLGAYLLYAWFFSDMALVYYVLFGLVVGVCELPIDAWLVRSSQTLIYPTDEPMLWKSPAYMPFAWAVVIVQVAVLGDALIPSLGLGVATVAVASFGGLYIPIYEHLAKGANLWFYKDTPMLFNAPYYVIGAEFMLGLPLVWMGLKSDVTSFSIRELLRVVGLGAIEGLLVMSVAVLVAFRLLGKEGPSHVTSRTR